MTDQRKARASTAATAAAAIAPLPTRRKSSIVARFPTLSRIRSGKNSIISQFATKGSSTESIFLNLPYELRLHVYQSLCNNKKPRLHVHDFAKSIVNGISYESHRSFPQLDLFVETRTYNPFQRSEQDGSRGEGGSNVASRRLKWKRKLDMPDVDRPEFPYQLLAVCKQVREELLSLFSTETRMWPLAIAVVTEQPRIPPFYWSVLKHVDLEIRLARVVRQSGAFSASGSGFVDVDMFPALEVLTIHVHRYTQPLVSPKSFYAGKFDKWLLDCIDQEQHMFVAFGSSSVKATGKKALAARVKQGRPFVVRFSAVFTEPSIPSSRISGTSWVS